MTYLIGQRVVVGTEIGTVVADGGKGTEPAREGEVWVFRPSKGFPSKFAAHNVQPLPNGQL